MKARVFVTLKKSVFDPQGRTIAEALHSLGYTGVADVRQGKYFELDIDAASPAEAERLAGEAAAKLLANPVIESYRIEVDS
jgi:phosphoribosylformylglycinamidine synthase